MKNIHIIPSAIVLHYAVPDIILNDLHNYTEEVLEDKQYHDKRNAEPFLAADIRQQYFLNQSDPRVSRYCDWQQSKAVEYIQTYIEQTKIETGSAGGYPDCEIKTEDIWSVHSFENEYNPIHSHNVETGYGLATVTYTKLPESMKIHKPEDEARYNEYGLQIVFDTDIDGGTGTHWTYSPIIYTQKCNNITNKYYMNIIVSILDKNYELICFVYYQ